MRNPGETLTVFDELLYDGEWVRVGRLSAPADHALFEFDGPTYHHAVQFHWTPVVFERTRGRHTADPNVASFFNRGEEFRRVRAGDRGEESLWIAFDIESLLEELQVPGRLLKKDSVDFAAHYRLVDSEIFQKQAKLAWTLRRREQPPRLWVEETAVDLLFDVLAGSVSQATSPPRPADLELAEAVRDCLGASKLESRLTLSRVSSTVGCSPFRVARAFKAALGVTVHQYRNQLRLRAAIPRLLDGELNLTDLALDLGYSSHSHFTYRFRRAFGKAPSDLRRWCQAMKRVWLSG